MDWFDYDLRNPVYAPEPEELEEEYEHECNAADEWYDRMKHEQAFSNN